MKGFTVVYDEILNGMFSTKQAIIRGCDEYKDWRMPINVYELRCKINNAASKINITFDEALNRIMKGEVLNTAPEEHVYLNIETFFDYEEIANDVVEDDPLRGVKTLIDFGNFTKEQKETFCIWARCIGIIWENERGELRNEPPSIQPYGVDTAYFLLKNQRIRTANILRINNPIIHPYDDIVVKDRRYVLHPRTCMVTDLKKGDRVILTCGPTYYGPVYGTDSECIGTFNGLVEYSSGLSKYDNIQARVMWDNGQCKTYKSYKLSVVSKDFRLRKDYEITKEASVEKSMLLDVDLFDDEKMKEFLEGKIGVRCDSEEHVRLFHRHFTEKFSTGYIFSTHEGVFTGVGGCIDISSTSGMVEIFLDHKERGMDCVFFCSRRESTHHYKTYLPFNQFLSAHCKSNPEKLIKQFYDHMMSEGSKHKRFSSIKDLTDHLRRKKSDAGKLCASKKVV